MPIKEHGDFKREAAQLIRLSKALPVQLAQEYENFVKDNFRKGGFRNRKFEPWEPRKNDTDPGRAVLIDKPFLRDSVQALGPQRRGNRVVIVITAEAPYAQIHNEGGRVVANQRVGRHERGPYTDSRGRKVPRHSVRPHRRTLRYEMPQRQFMGDSQYFRKHFRQTVERQVRKIFPQR